MHDNEWLLARFEESRAHLRAVAYRMLGSMSEAEDAVQESWLRFQRADVASVDNLGGWLTTVVARICLDVLRSRRARVALRHEAVLPGEHTPESDAVTADAVGLALLVVLDNLDPAERTAFVLHDMFDLSFEDIARIVGRSPVAARQLASRARRRVRGATTTSEPDLERKRQVVDAFLAASRGGDFDALLAVLDPNVVLRADNTAVQTAAATHWATLASELRGAPAVAQTLKDAARGATRALIDGIPGAVWAPGGQTRSAFVFKISAGKIAEIDIIMEPSRIAELDVELLR